MFRIQLSSKELITISKSKRTSDYFKRAVNCELITWIYCLKTYLTRKIIAISVNRAIINSLEYSKYLWRVITRYLSWQIVNTIIIEN